MDIRGAHNVTGIAGGEVQADTSSQRCAAGFHGGVDSTARAHQVSVALKNQSGATTAKAIVRSRPVSRSARSFARKISSPAAACGSLNPSPSDNPASSMHAPERVIHHREPMPCQKWQNAVVAAADLHDHNFRWEVADGWWSLRAWRVVCNFTGYQPPDTNYCVRAALESEPSRKRVLDPSCDPVEWQSRNGRRSPLSDSGV